MSDELVTLIRKFFEDDTYKVRAWFATRNPLLGGSSPNDMIAAGRREKLLRFIKTQLAENEPDTARDAGEER